MDNLKSIWNQLDCTSNQATISVSENNTESIFEKLLKEENLRRKFNPFLVVFIIAFTIFFAIIIDLDSFSFFNPKVIGLFFITLASITIAIFSQIVKIPLNQFEHDKSSVLFLETVKQKLDKTKKMLVLGIVLQLVFLSTGLYFIIFFGSNLQEAGTQLFIFFGMMVAIGGAAIGTALAAFSLHYKSTYEVINQFSQPDLS